MSETTESKKDLFFSSLTDKYGENFKEIINEFYQKALGANLVINWGTGEGGSMLLRTEQYPQSKTMNIFYFTSGGRLYLNPCIERNKTSEIYLNSIGDMFGEEIKNKLVDGKWLHVTYEDWADYSDDLFNMLVAIDAQMENHIMNKTNNFINDPEKQMISFNVQEDTVSYNNEPSLYDFFLSKKFIFPKSLITRYYLSVKTKPFVILTGISGTGKTKIAQLFADYMLQDMDQEEKDRHYAFISVRPDWMDSKGLLGFYNLLEEKYYPTKLLNLLIDAWKNPEEPYFVILDEMNLAKVEQYFSDFLSVMESRTKDNPDGEYIELHNRGQHVESTLGSRIPSRIKIPANVYFTGTVNVDETTYMFSPKVLDRANVIEFNDVYLPKLSTHDDTDAFALESGNVKSALPGDGNDVFASIEDFEDLLNYNHSVAESINDILNTLKEYNLHFGYRTVNELSKFINHSSDSVSGDINESLDYQILQKVLPKFHGTEEQLYKPLDKLKEFCKANNLTNSEAKLQVMLNQLKQQGYTSFIQ